MRAFTAAYYLGTANVPDKRLGALPITSRLVICDEQAAQERVKVTASAVTNPHTSLMSARDAVDGAGH
jgi:hypothetical protein